MEIKDLMPYVIGIVALVFVKLFFDFSTSNLFYFGATLLAAVFTVGCFVVAIWLCGGINIANISFASAFAWISWWPVLDSIAKQLGKVPTFDDSFWWSSILFKASIEIALVVLGGFFLYKKT